MAVTPATVSTELYYPSSPLLPYNIRGVDSLKYEDIQDGSLPQADAKLVQKLVDDALKTARKHRSFAQSQREKDKERENQPEPFRRVKSSKDGNWLIVEVGHSFVLHKHYIDAVFRNAGRNSYE